MPNFFKLETQIERMKNICSIITICSEILIPIYINTYAWRINIEYYIVSQIWQWKLYANHDLNLADILTNFLKLYHLRFIFLDCFTRTTDSF